MGEHGRPRLENGDGGLLKYAKLVDSERFGVWGVALVMNGFKACLHFHPEDETYYFLWGEGEMIIGDGNRGDTTKRLRFSAPAKVHIPADTPHAMTPVSNYVVLLYTFPNGPFEKSRIPISQSTCRCQTTRAGRTVVQSMSQTKRR